VRRFTVEEKLAVVDAMIERRRLRCSRDARDEHTYAVLKAIALDLRARLPGRPSTAEDEIGRRVEAVAASQTALGYSNGALVGLAEQVVGHWPAVKQGLELLREGR
jgi:hypothetical protein